MSNKVEIQVAATGVAQASAALKGLQGTLEGTAARIKSTLGAAAGVAGLAGLGAGFAAAAHEGLNFNSTIETQTVAFKTLLGSMTEARMRLDELTRFGAETPFELPEVVQANRLLQTLTDGAMAAREGMLLVGDTASGVGGKFEELSMWMGRLYAGLANGTPVGEATMRLVELGAISGKTAQHLNKTAQEGLAVGRAMDVMRETFGRFSGSMKDQANTFAGLMSTLKDGLRGFAGGMTEGLFGDMKKGVEALTKFDWVGAGKGVAGYYETMKALVVTGGITTGVSTLIILLKQLAAANAVAFGSGAIKGVREMAAALAAIGGASVGGSIPIIAGVAGGVTAAVAGYEHLKAGRAESQQAQSAETLAKQNEALKQAVISGIAEALKNGQMTQEEAGVITQAMDLAWQKTITKRTMTPTRGPTPARVVDEILPDVAEQWGALEWAVGKLREFNGQSTPKSIGSKDPSQDPNVNPWLSGRIRTAEDAKKYFEELAEEMYTEDFKMAQERDQNIFNHEVESAKKAWDEKWQLNESSSALLGEKNKDAAQQRADTEVDIFMTTLQREADAEAAAAEYRQQELDRALNAVESGATKALQAQQAGRTALDGDWTRTPQSKWAERKRMMEEELRLMKERAEAIRRMADTPGISPETRQLVLGRADQADAAVMSKQGELASIGPDPNNMGQQIQSQMTDLVSQWGTLAEQIGHGFRTVIGSSVQSVSDGIVGLIEYTQTWEQALANIRKTIIHSIIQSIVDMGVKWVMTHVIMKGAMTSLHALGSMLKAKETAETISSESAKTPILATNAGLASGSSWGMSAIAGTVAFAALIAAVAAAASGAFAEGGRPPVGEMALVGEKGPELFVPDVEGTIIPNGKTEKLLRGGGSAGGLRSGSGAFADNRRQSERPVNVGIFDDRTAMRDWLDSAEGEKQVINILDRRGFRRS